MGVKGLWYLLNSTEEKISLDQLGGQKIAIDLAIWMCHDMTVKYNSNVTLKLYVRNLFFRISHLLLNNVLPVGVCDGAAPILKKQVMAKRMQEAGKVLKSTARSYFRRISTECCVLLDCLGVPSLESVGEAEAMCALLNSQEFVDACMTSDGDAFLYGALKVYSALSLQQGDAHVSVFRASRIASRLGMDRARLILMGMLLGCDMTGRQTLGGVKRKEAVEWLQCLTRGLDVMPFLRHFDEERMEIDLQLDRDILRRIREKMEAVADFPRHEIVEEFLGVEKWSLPQKPFAWSRPQPEKLTIYCRRHLDWEEKYTLSKVLPLVAHWDLLHPLLVREPPLRPKRIVRRRQIRFVPSFEVEWHKFGFDSWHDEDSYHFSVPQFPFCDVHVSLTREFEEAEAEKKKKTKKAPRRKKKTEEAKAAEMQEEKEVDNEKRISNARDVDRLAATLESFHVNPDTPGQVPRYCRLETSLVDSLTPRAPISNSAAVTEDPFDDVDSPLGLRERLLLRL